MFVFHIHFLIMINNMDLWYGTWKVKFFLISAFAWVQKVTGEGAGYTIFLCQTKTIIVTMLNLFFQLTQTLLLLIYVGVSSALLQHHQIIVHNNHNLILTFIFLVLNDNRYYIRVVTIWTYYKKVDMWPVFILEQKFIKEKESTSIQNQLMSRYTFIISNKKYTCSAFR
jgi:hypothetical protein